MAAEPPKSPYQALGERFHLMMGECVAAWANVDTQLFRIFHECMRAPLEQCAIVYYRTPGLDARFGLVTELVQSVLPKRPRKSGGQDHPDVKAWKTAIAGYQKLLSVRRRVAHHPVAIRREPHRIGQRIGADLPSWFEIYVGEHERLREKDADLPALKADDLWEHVIAVSGLTRRLHLFYHIVLLPKRSAELSQPVAPSRQGRCR